MQINIAVFILQIELKFEVLAAESHSLKIPNPNKLHLCLEL